MQFNGSVNRFYGVLTEIVVFTFSGLSNSGFSSFTPFRMRGSADTNGVKMNLMGPENRDSNART